MGGMCGGGWEQAETFQQPSLGSLFLDAGFPVYLYEFEHYAPGTIVSRTDGADHGDEIGFILEVPFSKGAAPP